MDTIAQAEAIYHKNFPNTVTFERAIFYSWGCSIKDCTFCYMSTQPKDKAPESAVRSKSSLIAEALLCRELHWPIGFFSGGINAFTHESFLDILESLSITLNQKLWLNIGPVTEKKLQSYLPYVKGVVGSIETINPELHKKVCPSKPMKPYENMFLLADKYQLMKAMTFIVGLGETKDDFPLLTAFIKKYSITKIHIYGLNPIKGTPYENMNPPTNEQQAWWISQLRISFPLLDIQCGIWEDRIHYLPLLLKAGSNSISKFPMLRKFGSPICHQLLDEIKKSGRTFEGNITNIDAALMIPWHHHIHALPFDEDTKKDIEKKLNLYLATFRKNKMKI